ncbi:nucleolar GTP-binding protein 1 [Tanacetum coccineum]
MVEQGLDQLITVGAFQKLPMVMPSVDILHSTLRKARRVTPTKGIANAAKREKNKGAKHLDALMKNDKENFPNKRHLHPYERSLILTLGVGNYEEVLGRVDSLRKKVGSFGKELASLCAHSTSKREAEEGLGLKRLEDIYHFDGKAVDEVMQIAKYAFGFSPPTTLYFDEHVRHGKTIIGLAWEMDFESFLDPTLALENRDTPEGST